ncbi:MAG: SurA N-terminal domain-containing protein, partial [Thermomicrobiaceae bacterium]
MVQRIRTEFQRIMTGEGGDERMSQAELDSYRRQLVLLAVAVTTVALILILGIGAYYQYVHLPRQAVATVDGETISRSEYWDFRQYELLNQINQYQQFGQMLEGEQAQQYQQLAFEANQEFEDIEDASIDPVTINEMITNEILMDGLDEFGLEITQEEIDDRLVEFFTGTPISDEQTGPSADPTAEAWATATAEAQQQEAEDAQSEAEAEEDTGDAESDESGDAESENSESGDDTESDDAEPEESDESDSEDAELQDAESDEPDVVDDPGADEPENGDNEETEGQDEESDEEGEDAETTPTPEPTPSEEDIRATAEATQSDHQEFLLDRAGISHDEFVDMFIIPQIAREKIRNHLAEDIPTRAEQVQAAHILVATQDAS